MNVKVTKVQQKKEFEPVIVSIEINNEHQMANLLSRLDTRMCADEVIGALPQYGNWCNTPVNGSKYLHPTDTPFENIVTEIGNQLKWRTK